VSPRRARVVGVVAAWNEADRIGGTVAALLAIPAVAEVVVADDGSSDLTARAALEAGARVVRSERNAGKGAALEAAVSAAAAGGAGVIVLADGDLSESASALESVLRPVLAGRADLAVAVPPRPLSAGFGLVRRTAAWLVRRTSGFDSEAPLSGQRAATVDCLLACRPFAPGFGVDAAMLADAARLGFRVVEVPADVTHRSTGRDLAGFRHRARQGVDVVGALVPRAVGWR
jgi:glycosyltransferase involved in cell wall biosynthesis